MTEFIVFVPIGIVYGLLLKRYKDMEFYTFLGGLIGIATVGPIFTSLIFEFFTIRMLVGFYVGLLLYFIYTSVMYIL